MQAVCHCRQVNTSLTNTVDSDEDSISLTDTVDSDEDNTSLILLIVMKVTLH